MHEKFTTARTALIWLVAASAVIAGLVLGAERAGAGVYRVAQCHAGLGAGSPDVTFERSSGHYRASSACGELGAGLGITHAGRASRGGSQGSWSLRAPSGSHLLRVRAMVSGRAKGGHLPELLTGGGLGAARAFGRATGAFHPASWSGAARRFAARLRCARPSCGPGREAHLHVRRLMLTLRDEVEPRLELGGSLLAAGSQRGREQLDATAADDQSGVRRVLLEVNGEPVGARSPGCAIAAEVATRLRPCPQEARGAFLANTAQSPFVQGPNVIRTCVLDYAADTAANRACASRRVRVDNACPLAGTDEAGRLRVRAEAVRRGARRRGGVIVSGRLTAPDGGAIAAATVCIATRPRLRGAAERVVATPTTTADGHFRARLGRGPNRELRVAYWRDSEHVSERYLRLRAAARPRLLVRPRGTLSNGQRARFRVSLPGPAAAGRKVSLKVRANGRWLSLRRGRTNARGRWSADYRFRATTGTRSYRFRAFVPRQPGYPYEAGSSAPRRVRVRG